VEFWTSELMISIMTMLKPFFYIVIWCSRWHNCMKNEFISIWSAIKQLMNSSLHNRKLFTQVSNPLLLQRIWKFEQSSRKWVAEKRRIIVDFLPSTPWNVFHLSFHRFDK
jgi:hypothetical protein